jgi:tetratricopeptide (TPR) repeat protein/tRNA A-37 threonylcarbamoyl transferase component Bud32
MDAPFPPQCALRYEPVRRLAEGGFGSVWLANQVALGRQAAVKVLHHAVLDDPAQVERFTSEALMTASLAHPNVVVIYEHGVEGGVPWIAYEYLTGRTLRSALAQARLSLKDALSAAAQVAAALAAAHERGILHRDVKPENVIRDATGHCKLTDFGIGKWTGGGGVRTADGLILGTPGYISPEQIRGAPAPPAADLYALGAMLHELICGSLPFPNAELAVTFRRQVEEDPPSLTDRVHGLPPGLDELARSALARDPRRRVRGAADFLRELERIIERLGPEGAHVAPLREATARGSGAKAHASPTDRASHATRVAGRAATAVLATPLAVRMRRRAPAVLLGLFATLAILAAVQPRPSLPPTSPTPAPASRPATPAPVTTVPPPPPPSPTAVPMPAMSPPPHAPLPKPEIEALVRAASKEYEAGQYDAAAPKMLRVLAADPRHPDALKILPGVYERAFKFREAEATYRYCLLVNPEDWPARAQLANILRARGLVDEAITHFVRVIPTISIENSIHSRMGLGQIYLTRKDFRRALEVLEPAAGFTGQWSALAQHFRARALDGSNRGIEAAAVWAQALALDDIGESFAAIANELMALGRKELGLQFVARALHAGIKDPPSLNSVGWWLLAEGQGEPSEKIFRDVIAAGDRVPAAHRGLARSLQMRHRLEEAAREMAIAIARAPNDPGTLVDATRLHIERRQLGEAAALLAHAEKVAPDEPEVYFLRHQLLVQQGRKEEARALLRRGAAAAQETRNAQKVLLYASLAHHARELSLARELFESACALSPAAAHARLGLARLLMEFEAYDEASQRLAQAIRLDPAIDDAKWAFVDLLRRLSVLAEIERHARTLVHAAPRFLEGYRILGSALERQKRNDEAVSVYERCLKFHPTADDIHRRKINLQLNLR